ncbi:MFS general substrate transporter [Aspergillus aculeatinus CBS 121060]|uniref:MFS general substrate transporter n=1 Tax=Aspergillus aculeatinus CBS 121060 TaxID=1448322 RepID=A0ACD1H1D0_9EURO|nr:MFS general substrate transporter [Aspergillus aculeatinus CBS 121060]RAH67269.1 MFS general substrate transporter [Aspergillus aculeatinus CBS 121060]
MSVVPEPKDTYFHEPDGHIDDLINIPGYDPNLQPTAGETRKAKMKVDLYILPFIVVCFCFLQFDRTNIGNALTDTLRVDIHVSNSAINMAQTLFTVGFIITELPFNVISRYIGPERFLPITMFVWGVATWSQIFIKNASGLIAARFFIGALEGGYIPGFALYISQYYTHQELALRYAIFWASNSFAGILGGPISVGLLSLGGRSGLQGWQWLFLIGEFFGLLTCFLGIVAYLYLPHSPIRPKTFFRRSYNIFTPREASILITRVLNGDRTTAQRAQGHHQRQSITLSDVCSTFTDWRLYGHLAAAFLSMLMISPMNTYAPSIIKSLGFTSLQANGLNSVGSAGALLLSVILALSSDRSQERGVHIAVGYLWGAAGLLWLALAPDSSGKWLLYGGVVWTQMGMGCAQAISAAWLTTKMPERKRPVALAAYVMSIQLANLPGNQLFRTQDAPRYTRGLIIAASCAIGAAVIILVWKVLYRVFDWEDNLAEREQAGSYDASRKEDQP